MMPNTPQPKKRPPKKIANGLVALGSAAIVSVYAAGYMRTQSAEAGFDVQALPTSVMPALQIATEAAATSTPTTRFRPIFATSAPITAPTSVAAIAPTATPLPAPTRAASIAPTTAPSQTGTTVTTTTAGKYRDGSYIGMGRSRHGNIEVTVVVQGGAIASTKISQCLTRYPCSMIAALPGQVVARQSATVDFVSGATDSSTAFREAVANALAQGK